MSTVSSSDMPDVSLALGTVPASPPSDRESVTTSHGSTITPAAGASDIWVNTAGVRCIGPQKAPPLLSDRFYLPLKSLKVTPGDPGVAPTEFSASDKHGNTLRAMFDGDWARLGYVNMKIEPPRARDDNELAILKFMSTQLASVTMAVNRWTHAEGSDVTLELQIPLRFLPFPAPIHTATIFLDIDTRHESGFCAYRFEKLKGRLKKWCRENNTPFAIPLTRALTIPPPGQNFSRWGPLRPDFDTAVPSTWVPKFRPLAEGEVEVGLQWFRGAGKDRLHQGTNGLGEASNEGPVASTSAAPPTPKGPRVRRAPTVKSYEVPQTDFDENSEEPEAVMPPSPKRRKTVEARARPKPSSSRLIEFQGDTLQILMARIDTLEKNGERLSKENKSLRSDLAKVEKVLPALVRLEGLGKERERVLKLESDNEKLRVDHAKLEKELANFKIEVNVLKGGQGAPTSRKGKGKGKASAPTPFQGSPDEGVSGFSGGLSNLNERVEVLEQALSRPASGLSELRETPNDTFSHILSSLPDPRLKAGRMMEIEMEIEEALRNLPPDHPNQKLMAEMAALKRGF